MQLLVFSQSERGCIPSEARVNSLPIRGSHQQGSEVRVRTMDTTFRVSGNEHTLVRLETLSAERGKPQGGLHPQVPDP